MARPTPNNGDTHSGANPFHNPLNPLPDPKRVPAGDEPQIKPRHTLRPVDEYIEWEEEMRLRIPESEWPAGYALQWVTEAVWGRPEMQHRARFERSGWVPVHQEDFENKFRGLFHPWDYAGEIKVDGLVLMARPKSWSERARDNNISRARQRVIIKEQQLRQGALEGVTLSPQHPTAVRSNIVERSIDTVSMPVPQR